MNKAQFDTTTTHMSYYDRFLDPEEKAYMEKSRNLTGDIVMMTPEEYYQECVKIFGNKYDVDNLIQQRSDQSLGQYVEDMKNGDVFPLCFINYAEKSQEGLHRMLAAAQAFGWDKEYPVLVITPYDMQEWEESKRWKKYNDFCQYDLNDAIDQAKKELQDWSAPVPDDIAEQMSDRISNILNEQGYDVDVECEIQDGRIATYLNSLDGYAPETIHPASHALWLEDMFDTEEDSDSDSELDLDEALLEDEDFYDLLFS